MKNTNQLFETLENNIPLDISGRVYFDTFSLQDDGPFPHLSDWSRFINTIDKNGAGEYIEKHFKGYNIQSINETKNYGVYTILFKEPITILLATINGEPVTAQAQLFTATISHEWYHSSYDHKQYQQWKKATGVEIFLEDIKTV